MTKLIVTVTGPSGSGKTELVHELCLNHNFAKLVSVTTRAKRPGEVEGKDYYFISEQEFTDLEQNENLVQATIFNGVSYGTTRIELKRIETLGKTPIVIVEPTGIPQFKHICNTNGYQLRTVFLTADAETLVERYLKRITGADESARLRYHAKRIFAIKDEVEWGSSWEFDIRLLNEGSNIRNIARIAEIIGELYGSKSRDAA